MISVHAAIGGDNIRPKHGFIPSNDRAFASMIVLNQAFLKMLLNRIDAPVLAVEVQVNELISKPNDTRRFKDLVKQPLVNKIPCFWSMK